MQGMKSARWSPYAVGTGIGLLGWFAFATVDRGLGIPPLSSTVVAALGMFVGAFAFVQAFHQLSRVQKAAADFGEITLPSATPIPAGAWVAGLLALVTMIYVGTRMRRRFD